MMGYGGYGGNSPLQRSNTGQSFGGSMHGSVHGGSVHGAQPPMQRAMTGDIQNTADDIEGGNAPIFSGADGYHEKGYPVLGFGFCSTKGRRPYNEDRVVMTPRVNGSVCTHLQCRATFCFNH
jgi:hypothetical protein